MHLRSVVLSSVLLVLAACGGGGGEDDTTLVVAPKPTAAPTPVPVANYTCEHDGNIYSCNNEGNCATVAEAVEPEATGEDEITKTRYIALKLSTGAITIIAECGSTVNFSPSETTTTNTTTSETDNSTDNSSSGVN